MVGKLRMSLYGTRDAAANFQDEVRGFMVSMGFRQGKYNPCTFFQEGRKVRTKVMLARTPMYAGTPPREEEEEATPPAEDAAASGSELPGTGGIILW